MRSIRRGCCCPWLDLNMVESRSQHSNTTVMKAAPKIALMALTILVFSSCATRIECDLDAPKLKNSRDIMSKAGQKGIVSAYVCSGGSNHAKDGFQLSHVNSITEEPVCGMGLIRSIVTLGLIPVELPHPLAIEVEGEIKGREQRRIYRVNLHTSTSVWHRLVPATSDNRAIARGLMAAMRSAEPVSVK